MPIAPPPWPIPRTCILTDFAKLKKLLVSPVTMLDEPTNGRSPHQVTANENQHLLLCIKEWPLLGPQLSRAWLRDDEDNGRGGWCQVDLILTKLHWIKEEVAFLKVTISLLCKIGHVAKM